MMDEYKYDEGVTLMTVTGYFSLVGQLSQYHSWLISLVFTTRVILQETELSYCTLQIIQLLNLGFIFSPPSRMAPPPPPGLYSGKSALAMVG